MQSDITTKQLRSFGLTVGGIFAVIAFWPTMFRNESPQWSYMAISICLVFPAIVFPKSLFWIYKGLMALGHVMGWINTRIILGLVFYIVVTPTGVLRRLLGKDPMGKQLKHDLESYRIIRKPRPASHLTNQY